MNAPSLRDLPVWISSPVVASIVGLIGTIAVYLTRRSPTIGRNHAKRLTALELTEKRLELRDQILKLELAAAKGAVEENEAKQRAQLAVQRITSDANLMMKQLEWSDQITRLLTKKSHNLTETPIRGLERFLYWFTRMFSYLLVIAAAIYLAGFVVILLGLPWLVRHNARNALSSLMIMTAFSGLFFLVGYVFFSRQAQELKYPKPDGPILDEI